MGRGPIHCLQHSLPSTPDSSLDLCQAWVKAMLWMSSTRCSCSPSVKGLVTCVLFGGQGIKPYLSTCPKIQLSLEGSSHFPLTSWTPRSPSVAPAPLSGIRSQRAINSPWVSTQNCELGESQGSIMTNSWGRVHVLPLPPYGLRQALCALISGCKDRNPSYKTVRRIGQI